MLSRASRVYRESARVEIFTSVRIDLLDRLTLQKQLDAIGTQRPGGVPDLTRRR
ncbi:MAG TPA: hypothetical protein VFX12_05000 [Vicinamibacterales bacterium]|nr:hypothetical protein [Vicinamibacterales bacterium]